MSDFYLWFGIGFHHIIDWRSYDHICYIASLTVLFSIQEWKKLLILITAFTIGHSLTLALSTLGVFSVSQNITECLIPITILITCAYNIYMRNKKLKSLTFNYVTALFFGLIHGLGFSYLLRSLLGKEGNIVGPLFSFNAGLEAGQLLIVACMLFISLFLETFLKVTKKNYVLFVSVAVFGTALLLLIERIRINS